MEGEQGENRTPAAGSGRRRRSRPRGTGRLRQRPGWARVFAALSAGPGRRRPPRAHPSLCLLLAREPRFRGARSRRALQGRRFGFWPPSAAHFPALAALRLWALVGPAVPRCWDLSGLTARPSAPGPARASGAGPTAPSDPASPARADPPGPRGPAASGTARPGPRPRVAGSATCWRT